MADHPNAQVARTAIEAFSKGDMDAFVGTLADDVRWHPPGNNRFSGTREGKDATVARFAEQREAGFVVSIEDIHDVLANDEHTVAMVSIKVASGDRSVETPAVFVMHLRDGKLAEFWQMVDRQADVDALFG